MYKVEFGYRNYTVKASCKDVSSYGATGLRVDYFDDDGVVYDTLRPEEYDEMKELATEKLYEEKFHREL